MTKPLRTLAGCLLGLALLTTPLMAKAPVLAGTGPTPLDAYVAKKDSVYGWKLANTIKGAGYTDYVLDLTSQSWRGPGEVDHPVWKHWLHVVVPDHIVSDKGFMYIEGGSINDPVPTTASARAVKVALDTGTVAAEVHMVPNQPLKFPDAPTVGRSEDDLIAYSRVRFMDTKDPEWLVRLAMVKSGTRAMDAVQEFMRSPAGGNHPVSKFVVSGGSKRAWTAWLVAAVDKRVMGVIPFVIDALNSEEVTKHGFEAYGEFSSSLQDYVNHGIFPQKIGTPEYKAVLDIEDPFVYRDRPQMKMPKYEINASGDQFFTPDNSQFYYGALPEEKRIRYVPNARHNLGDTDAQDSMVAFYQAVITNHPRPSYSWTKDKDGTLHVRPQGHPREVRVWQATNPNARDFRKDVIGNAYFMTTMHPGKDGSYTYRAPNPPKGYTAFFIELVYDSGFKYPFKFSSEVSVVPTAMPFQWSQAAARYPTVPVPPAPKAK